MTLSFTSEVHMAAPPEDFFAGFADMAGWSAWMSGLVRAERLTPGAFGVGTQWRETRRMFGHEGSEVMEVTEWSPPQRLALYVDGRKGTTGKGAFRFRYELTPEGDGTRVRMRGEIDMPGWFARLLGRLLVRLYKKGCDRDLVDFARYLAGRRAGDGS